MIRQRATKSGLRYDVRLRDPQGKVYNRTFRTKKEALAFDAAERTDRHRGTWYDERRGQQSFDSYVNQWWPTQVDLRPSSRARDASYLRTHIQPHFGAFALGDITPMMVRAWVAELNASKAPATVQKALQILRKILATAVSDGLLASNPATGVKTPRIEQKEMRFLGLDEIEDLAAAMDPRYRAAVHLFSFGGLRAGELFGLRGAAVDPLRKRVEIREAVVEVHGQLHIGPPKTDRSRRSVPIPKVVATILSDHMKASGTGPDDFVFPSPNGQAVRLRLWRQRFWTPAIAAAGVAPLRVHDLRHTAVALWIAAGASPKEVADRAGHRSVVTVLDRYGHLLPGTEERVNDALDELHEAARRDRSRRAGGTS